MANPTTNYGFVLPTSTDLVTDLPADFDIALQGVDTRLKALQPGTTLGDIAYSSATANTNTRLPIGTSGQVLAVSGGGVPAWTTTADVTPLTTKGDLFTFTTADARLGVGTDGQTLVADSSTATGLKWASASSGAVVQVKSATYSTATSNTSGTYADTGLSLSITPTSASNKVLVMVSQAFYMNRLNEELGVNFRLMEGASAIFTDAFANWQYVNTFTTSTDWGWQTRYDVTYLAAPATTSATTYKTQFAVAVTASSPLVTAQESSRISTITLMEVTP